MERPSPDTPQAPAPKESPLAKGVVGGSFLVGFLILGPIIVAIRHPLLVVLGAIVIGVIVFK